MPEHPRPSPSRLLRNPRGPTRVFQQPARPGLRLILAAAFTALALEAFSLDPHVPVTQYVRRHWGRAEGIPDTSVFAVTETREGYLWLGTEVGPVRFDGVRFVHYGPETTAALDGSLTTSILERPDGSLLIGSRGGLAEYRGGIFRRIPRPGGPEETIITDLFQDASGRVWVSSEGRLGYFEGETYHLLPGPEGKPLVGVGRVRQTQDGTIWFGDGPLLIRWRDGRLETRQLSGVSQTIVAGARGRVWAFPGGRVELAAGEGAPLVLSMAPGAAGAISAREDREGTLWVGSVTGLFRCREGRISPVELRAGSPPGVSSITEDREGRLWIGTIGDGLFCLQDPLVRTFGKPEGLDAGYAATVLPSRDGALWIGTPSNGLIRWDGREARHLGEREGLPRQDVTSILEDSSGTLWVGTPEGLMKSDGKGRFVSVVTPGKKISTVFSLAQLPDGTIVAGTPAGVFAYKAGRWEVVEPSRGYGFPLAIEPARGGGAWLATLGRGLLYWDGRALRSFGPKEGLPATDLPCLCTDSKGRIWIGTVNRGLVARDREGFRVLGPTEGLPEGPIYQILEAAGSLWLSGKAGITQIALPELDAWLAGTAHRVSPQRYGETDGMRSPECNGGYQPAGCKGLDGVLWFPTLEGVVRVDPARLSEVRRPVSVVVEEVLTNGAPAAQAGGVVRLPPGRTRLEVHYTAPCLTAPHRLGFEFLLEGFDPDWVSTGTRRVASYTNLPPGRYRFRVRASESGGPWVESSTALAVVQAPHLWQTLPFLLACTALMGLLLYGIYRLRLRAMRKRFEAILEERARISREIHDSLTQSFAGVVLNLEAADRTWAGDGTASRQRVSRAKGIAKEGLAEARRFVRGLRPLHLESEDLASALDRLARETSERGTAAVSFHTEGGRRKLPAHLEDQLLRIAQEALANAGHHAEAARIQLSLAVSRTEVVLSVEDDGRGFDPNAMAPQEKGGFGLRGIRERTEQLKGTFGLRSAPGEGTTITVHVPL